MSDDRKVGEVTVDELVAAIVAKLKEPQPVTEVIHTPFGDMNPNEKVTVTKTPVAPTQREWRTAADLVTMMPEARKPYTDLEGPALKKIRDDELAQGLAEDCMQRFYPRY